MDCVVKLPIFLKPVRLFKSTNWFGASTNVSYIFSNPPELPSSLA